MKSRTFEIEWSIAGTFTVVAESKEEAREKFEERNLEELIADSMTGDIEFQGVTENEG